jgi:hypothetical protein
MPANKKFQGHFFPDKEGTSRKLSFTKFPKTIAKETKPEKNTTLIKNCYLKTVKICEI